MTSRGNLNTLRSLFTWNSTWYSKTSYKQLVFRDLVLDLYLSSLCYKLKIASTYFSVKKSLFDFNIITADLYLFKKRNLILLVFKSVFLKSTIAILYLLDKYRTKSSQRRHKEGVNLTTNPRPLYYNCNLLCFLFNFLFFFMFLLYNCTFFIFWRIFLLTSVKSWFIKHTHLLNLFYKKNFFHVLIHNNNNKTNRIPFTPTPFFYKWDALFSIFYGYNNYKKSDKKISFLSSFVFLKNRLALNYSSSLPIEVGALKPLFPELLYITKKKNQLYRTWFLRCRVLVLNKTMFSSKKRLGILLKIKKISFFFFKIVLYHIVTFYNRTDASVKDTFFVLLHKIKQFHKSKYKYSTLRDDYYSNLINVFSYKIEQSLLFYTNTTYLFLPTVYINTKPSITDSKIVCEYIVFCLESGYNMNQIWKDIKRWVLHQLFFLENSIYYTKPITDSAASKYPLKGIRAICKGPRYAARRKRKVSFHSWVSDEFVTGKMPSQSFSSQLDFFQSFAILKSSSIGVKVWTLFEFI